jgi:hypothetical protein
MKLKTKVNVTCSVNGEVAPYTGKVVGEVLVIIPLQDGGLKANIEYQREDLTPLLGKVVTYSAEQVETLYQAIKGELTKGLNGVLSLNEQVLFAFIIEMSKTFGISSSEIEIVA